MVFRYDNAQDPKARPLPAYPHHKHIGTKIVKADAPSLKEVLDDVETYF
jgi:hypothetical protein